MKLLALTALLATVKAQDEDNSADIALGAGKICSPESFPDANHGFDPDALYDYNEDIDPPLTSAEECYAYALEYVMDQVANSANTFEECWYAKQVEASQGVEAAFYCYNTYAPVNGEFDTMDIRVVADEEAGVTYHAWQWIGDVNYDHIVEEPEEPEEEEDDEEEEGGQMLTASAFTAALFILTQV